MVFVEQRNSLNTQSGTYRFYHNGGKRGLDIVLCLLLMPIWLPLSVLFWGLALLETGSGGYGDLRIGRNGQGFTCLKIRTLRGDVSRRCAAEKACLDSRATRFGRFLRRSSLDELPQFWCVLKGEMSLVGPRPVPEMELKRYAGQRSAYLQMRPGVTGLWQSSGRNALAYSNRVALDVEYAHSVSALLDLKIIALTVLEIFRLSGR